MAIGDIYQFSPMAFRADQLGIIALNYVLTAQTGTGATNQDIANKVDLYLGVPFKALLSVTAAYLGSQIQRVSPLPIGAAAHSTVSSGAGGGGATGMPGAVAGLIAKSTGAGGRRAIGRTYIPFPSTSDDTGFGQPNVGYRTALQDFANLMVTPITVPGAGGSLQFEPVVWSKKFHQTFPYVRCDARGSWATQRRRSDYGRPNIPPF